MPGQAPFLLLTKEQCTPEGSAGWQRPADRTAAAQVLACRRRRTGRAGGRSRHRLPSRSPEQTVRPPRSSCEVLLVQLVPPAANLALDAHQQRRLPGVQPRERIKLGNRSGEGIHVAAVDGVRQALQGTYGKGSLKAQMLLSSAVVKASTSPPSMASARL